MDAFKITELANKYNSSREYLLDTLYSERQKAQSSLIKYELEVKSLEEKAAELRRQIWQIDVDLEAYFRAGGEE